MALGRPLSPAQIHEAEIESDELGRAPEPAPQNRTLNPAHNPEQGLFFSDWGDSLF